MPTTVFVLPLPPLPPQVLLVSACSGHGFKMSSGVGQLLAGMVAAGGGSGNGSGRSSGGSSDDELALHRLNPLRPGHAHVLELFGRRK